MPGHLETDRRWQVFVEGVGHAGECQQGMSMASVLVCAGKACAVVCEDGGHADPAPSSPHRNAKVWTCFEDSQEPGAVGIGYGLRWMHWYYFG